MPTVPFKEPIFWFGIALLAAAPLLLFEGIGGLSLLAVVVAALGLLALGFSFLGTYRPLPRIPVWIALLVVTCALLGYDYYDRYFGDTAHAVRTSVRLVRFQFRAPKWPIAPEIGKPTEMNIGISNFGPLPAAKVGWACKIFWSPVLDKPAEDNAWNDFVRKVPEKNEIDMDPVNESWSTFASAPMQSSELSGIAAGKSTLYVFLRYHYRDGGGLHNRELCESLQTPLTGSVPVWHPCLSHMKVQ